MGVSLKRMEATHILGFIDQLNFRQRELQGTKVQRSSGGEHKHFAYHRKTISLYN